MFQTDARDILAVFQGCFGRGGLRRQPMLDELSRCVQDIRAIATLRRVIRPNLASRSAV